jgi:hypothetical protein
LHNVHVLDSLTMFYHHERHLCRQPERRNQHYEHLIQATKKIRMLFSDTNKRLKRTTDQPIATAVVTCRIETLPVSRGAMKLQAQACHTPFRDNGNQASIRVPRMPNSHVYQQYDKQMTYSIIQSNYSLQNDPWV